MKYLQKVILENFQSHKYSEIEFNQELNVIVGPSDVGKSAIIRGIKWALYNEPAGDFFIREGEKECSVTLKFSDNTIVKRFRSKSKNMYILYNKDGEEIRFEGFGLSVPSEILDEVGIEKIYLDSNESSSINLGEQLDGPFLLSEKNSTRASAIGRLIGVNIIDDALRETLKDLRNLNTVQKITHSKIKETSKELENYDYIENLALDLKKIEELKHLIKDKSNKLELFKKRSKIYYEIQEELAIINMQLSKLINIKTLDYHIKELSSLIIKCKYFLKKQDSILSNKTMMNKLEGTLLKLNRVETIEDILTQLREMCSKVDIYRETNQRLKSIIKQISSNNEINIKLKQLPILEKDINKTENNIKRLNSIKDIYEKFTLNKNNISRGNTYINKLKNVENTFIVKENLEEKINILYKLKSVSNKYYENKNKILKEEKVIVNQKENIEKRLNEYKSLLSEIEVCPLCLSTIDNEKIENILENYK